jgi:SAM-dependent methyltransferase
MSLNTKYLEAKSLIVKHYKELLAKHKSGPEVAQCSLEGQQFRFSKLMEIGDLRGKEVLDIGCGLGDLYPALIDRFQSIAYTGVDIVPELVREATIRHRSARFLCLDLLETKLVERFDYVLISGIFNNAMSDSESFMKDMLIRSFSLCRKAIGFNFISKYANSYHETMAYHDPIGIFEFAINSLSRKVQVHHHYQRCDVSFFVYRDYDEV